MMRFSMASVVSVQEAAVLDVARFAVGAGELGNPALAWATQLGPTAARVLGETVTQGVVLQLARGGGWHQLQGKRLWERRQLPPLHATGNVVRLCSWVLAAQKSSQTPRLDWVAPVTLADDVFAALLVGRLADSGVGNRLASQLGAWPGFITVCLHLDRIVLNADALTMPSVDLERVAVAVDGLQQLLAERWADIEAVKTTVVAPAQLMALGAAQQQLLTLFLDACDAAGERALAGFLIEALRRWLSVPRAAADHARSLDRGSSLNERTEALRAGAASLRSLHRLVGWHREHKATHFIDDSYAQAQVLLAEWRVLDGPLPGQAAALLAQLEGLGSVAMGNAPP